MAMPSNQCMYLHGKTEKAENFQQDNFKLNVKILWERKKTIGELIPLKAKTETVGKKIISVDD